MFSKPSKDTSFAPLGPVSEPQPAPRPEPQPPRRTTPERTASVIGSDLLIKGGIEGRGEIQLQGRAWGDVKVERLIVGDTAHLEGSIDAAYVEVRGHVVGAITARQVRLFPSARVEGDITYEQLAIEMGAQFEGRCVQNRATNQTLPLPAPTPQGDDLDIPEAPHTLEAAQ